MAGHHNVIECPSPGKKKRQHESNENSKCDNSRTSKKRRLSKYLEHKHRSKTKTPLRNVTFMANLLHEEENNDSYLQTHTIEADPSDTDEGDNSSTSVWSCRITTDSSPEAACANTAESLLPNHIAETSASQDDAHDHTEFQSLSLVRNHIAEPVLEEGKNASSSASSECIQKDHGLGDNHMGRTASGAIHEDEYIEKGSSLDQTCRTNLQSSQDNSCNNDNSKWPAENEEEVNKVPPRFRGRVVDSIKNKHTRGVAEKKPGIPEEPESLLQQVLSRPEAPISLHKSSFLEDEIEFVDIIGLGHLEEHHAVIFRITVRGQSFLLKVHKYLENDISKFRQKYPLPNKRFDKESSVYARTAHLQDLPSSPTPKCYGYIELTKIPQARSRHQRHPFRSTFYNHAAYLDFLIQWEGRIGIENREWRHYFRDKPPSACVLRGIVLEDIPSSSLLVRYLSHQPKLIRSGLDSLSRLHKCGVLHGNVGALHHSLVANSDGRIVFVGFSNSSCFRKKTWRRFEKCASNELQLWESLFPKQRPKPRKQQAKEKATSN